jgi:hypothetical protein
MPNRSYLLIAGIAVGVLAACSSATSNATTAAAPCGLRGQDSVFVSGRPVYRDCAVDKKARLTSANLHPDFRPTQNGNTCYYVDAEYVVNDSGKVEIPTARIVRSNNQSLADAVTQMLPRVTYEPAAREGKPVRQIVVEHTQVLQVVTRSGQAPSAARGPNGPPRC